MTARIDPVGAKRRSDGFSGFPAVSLPRLRFNQKAASKVLIKKDFLVQGEPRKIFSPEFP
jgi:hypothetical protein